jgi:hypothetical protein
MECLETDRSALESSEPISEIGICVCFASCVESIRHQPMLRNLPASLF